MKKWFEKFLKSLEKANKDSFGDERMDCCSVNRKSSDSKNNRSKA